MRITTYMICLAASALALTACKADTNQTTEQNTVAETTISTTEETGSLDTGEESAKETAGDVQLSDIHEDIKEAYGENYIPSAEYDDTAVEDLFGVKKDLYEICIAEGPMISAHVDTFVAVKAVAGKGEEVEAALDRYRDNLLNETMQYPSNISKIQASQVVRHGDYVFFVMLGTPDSNAAEQGEEAELESAKKNNQVAIDIIDRYFE